MSDPARGPGADSAAPATIAVEAPPAARDIRDATVVKDHDLFLLADLEGNVRRGNSNGFGLYHRDTRFLSAFELSVQGLEPTILLSSGRWPFLGSYVLTNPNLVTEDGRTISEQSIQIRRHRVARPVRVSESLGFQNFNPFMLTLSVAIHVDADFADMFEVRGFARECVRQRDVAIDYADASVTFRYDGRDGLRRSTRVIFDPPPSRLADGVASYSLELAARGSQRISIEIEIDPGERPRTTKKSVSVGGKETIVRSSNAQFNAVLDQAKSDLQMLASGDDDAPFIGAGIPWYAALFGRDSILTALEHLFVAPSLAKQTLVLLARAQGCCDDPWRDEEPGKILHESRHGELARTGCVPFAPYFGSVDSTPLWIMLLGEYHRATGDLALVRNLRPNLDAALKWIDDYGDRDGDGFVEYCSRTSAGLINQGWKDSWDAIVHVDGSIAEPPIALVEVQGYVYAAKRHAARLFRALGEPARGAALDEQARTLRDRFTDAFWMPEQGFYCLALDGDKRRVEVISSNAGHALYTGIATPEHGRAVASRVVSEDLFSGWGVRTLSTRELRYNPVGYHVGTVWPHDNALIALGLKRYAAEPELLEVATGLFDACSCFPSFRMPELFAGFARSAFGVPVRYPVACNPQAWAAASWSMLLQAMLGICPDATARELAIIRPTLPPWLEWVRIERIAVGSGEVDLLYARVGERTVADILAMRGGVRVSFMDSWQD